MQTGQERKSKNGYTYVKTTTGWKLKHRVVAEGRLGRPLRHNERTRFIDRNRENVTDENIEVYVIKERSAKTKRARMEARIEDLQAQLRALDPSS